MVSAVTWQQIALYAAPVVALVLGLVLGRRTGAGARVGELEGRCEELGKDLERARAEVRAGVEALERTREELEGYRGRVTEHFAGTSDLLRDLTLQYRAVYDHLAEGARELCPEGFPGLEGGAELARLEREAGAQPELEFDAPEEDLPESAEAQEPAAEEARP